MAPRLPIAPLTALRHVQRVRWESTNAAASSSKATAPPPRPLTQSSASRRPTSSAEPIVDDDGKPIPPGSKVFTGTRSRDTRVVPPLARPLGINAVPSSDAKTWARRKEEMMDRDRHSAKRRALVKEATQGYFHDYNRARSASGGKLWIAPPVLIREDKALYFPDVSGKNLLGDEVHTSDLLKGKVTIVTILNTRLSEEHAASYLAPLLSDWPGHASPDSPIQFLQVNHQPNLLKSMLITFFRSSLKRTVPEERWGKYVVSSGEWDKLDVLDPLGVENTIIGYIYLIDPNLKVRWAACGPAQPKEVEDLRTATAVLIRRSQEPNPTPLAAEQPAPPLP